ncbi:MAG: NAD-dependent epimerase/dehydratase family protein [Parvularculaceae bacterium]
MLTQNDILFVTGGSGFIGRNVVRELVTRKLSVKALARSQKSADIVAGLGAIPVRGDLMDVAELTQGMHGATHLIHLAADTNHGVATKAQIQESLQGADNIYAVAKEAGIKRALHLSTEAVLLTGQALRNVDETRAIQERFPGAYSEMKAGAERIALAASGDGLEVVVVRPRFVWGRDDTTALPQLIDAAQSGKLAWIAGGRYKISTTHIANAVAGIMLGLENGRAGEVYFVTDGEPVIFREFICALLNTQNVEPPTKQVPRWLVAMVARIGDGVSRLTKGKISGPMSYQEYATLGVEVTLNIDKARSDLGYEPVISIQQGLKELRTKAW